MADNAATPDPNSNPVTAGLVPAIYAVKRQSPIETGAERERAGGRGKSVHGPSGDHVEAKRQRVDGRDKPGHDGRGQAITDSYGTQA